MLNVAEGCSVQIADHVRRHTEDAADLTDLKLSGLQKLGFVVRQAQRNEGHPFLQDSNTAGVGGASVGSVPAGSECSRIFHRVRMRQDTAGACTVGEELASVLLSGDTQTDSGLFKRNRQNQARECGAHPSVQASSVCRRWLYRCRSEDHLRPGQLPSCPEEVDTGCRSCLCRCG